MFEVSPRSHDATLGVRASGILTDADYRLTLFPQLEKTIAEHARARLLVEISDTFSGWDMAAAWDDAAFGLAHRADFSKIALVGGPQWVVWSARLFAPLISGELKVFPTERIQEAWAWIDAD